MAEEDELSMDMEDQIGDINGASMNNLEQSSEMTPSDAGSSWIQSFLNLRGNEFFCAVDEEYIQDDFNLTGLVSCVPYYDEALDCILDLDEVSETRSEELQDLVQASAEVLYGLIHARFILSGRGLTKMQEKYINGDFGRCPRVACQGQHVLPVGMTDTVRTCAVHVYCPRCQEAYYPRSSKHGYIDGSYFGTTFAHMFLLQFPDLIPKKPEFQYSPKIYGFKINKDSLYYKLRSDDNSNNDNNTTNHTNNSAGK